MHLHKKLVQAVYLRAPKSYVQIQAEVRLPSPELLPHCTNTVAILATTASKVFAAQSSAFVHRLCPFHPCCCTARRCNMSGACRQEEECFTTELEKTLQFDRVSKHPLPDRVVASLVKRRSSFWIRITGRSGKLMVSARMIHSQPTANLKPWLLKRKHARSGI